MSILASIAVAFGMYSRIPMPSVEWNGKSMRYAMSAFPLVGIVQAALCFVWGVVLWYVDMPPMIAAVGFTLIPLAVNGGIHLDGLADTSDALASHASRSVKLAILKDPHIGAFGVIALIAHLLTVFSLFTAFAVGLDNLIALFGIFALSRALSAWAIVQWPSAKKDGTAKSFHEGSAGNPVLAVLGVEMAGFAAILIVAQGLIGVAIVIVAGAALAGYRYVAMKQFGGVTGDLAGWFLQTAELAMVAVLVLGGVIL